MCPCDFLLYGNKVIDSLFQRSSRFDLMVLHVHNSISIIYFHALAGAFHLLSFVCYFRTTDISSSSYAFHLYALSKKIMKIINKLKQCPIHDRYTV